MRSMSITAGLAAAMVLLAACSSGNGSSSSTSSVPPSASASALSSAPEPAPSISGSAGTTTSTAVPAGLDAASTSWFDALCTTMLVPLNNIQQAHIPTGPDQSLAGDDQTQLEADRQARIDALNEATAALATTPPPGFDGGAEYATAVTTAIQTTAEALAADPEQAADLSPSGPFHPLDVAIGQVDSTVRNYALLIPSCNAAGGLPVDYGSTPTTTAATPADLDAASATWFDVMCTALGPVGVEANPSTPAELLTLQQTFATTITQTAATLATTPPPGFDGGTGWAASVIAVLQSSSATMTAALAQSTGELAALDPNDQAALESFKTKVSQPPGFKDAYTLLATMDTQVDPSVAAAVHEIPSCASIGL
jgi:hypothetical protein